MRKIALVLVMLAAAASSGCAALTAYAKERIRQEAYLAADVVVDRVVDRMDEKLDMSDEIEAEARRVGKALAREEVDRVLSDDRLDEAASAEEPEKEGPDAPDAGAPDPDAR